MIVVNYSEKVKSGTTSSNDATASIGPSGPTPAHWCWWQQHCWRTARRGRNGRVGGSHLAARRGVDAAWLAQEEDKLLRECLYALQEPATEQRLHVVSDVLTVRIPPSLRTRSKLGSGARDAISICGEAGWLYRRIESYIDRVLLIADGSAGYQQQYDPTTKHVGSISRALANALVHEMQSYRSFLAHMEGSFRTNGYCLRQILAEIRMPMARLKTLAMITDGLSDLGTGDNLLSALYLHTRHGDTRHVAVVHSLLTGAAQPWFHMLYLWTSQGVLTDPAHEFFVTELPITTAPNNHRNEMSTTSTTDSGLWHDRFRLHRCKVPQGILDDTLVEPAFILGKGINYIRKCLLDGAWSLRLDETNNGPHHETGEERRRRLGYYYVPISLDQSTPSCLQSTLMKASQLVHSHILDSLRSKHNLILHLLALKQFFFLGQGDFFSALMEGIYAEFQDKSVIAGIYRHSLSTIMESSLRSSNASGFPLEILQRLQVKLRDDSDTLYPARAGSDPGVSSRTVWDVFTLEYDVPDPLLAIIHPAAMNRYRRMFLFLFGLKKVEFMLDYTWRQSAVLQHALQASAQYKGLDLRTSPAYAQAIILLRQIAMTRQSMMHFVVNLKSYLMFEVLEGGWKELSRTMQASQTLEEAIQAHDSYLDSVIRKSLLDSGMSLENKVHELISLTGEFCRYQQQLFVTALEAAERVAEKRREAESRLRHGQWGFETRDKVTNEEESFFGLAQEELLEDLDRIADAFSAEMVGLLQALDQWLYGGPSNEGSSDCCQDDLDSLRFLTFQLDCNKFYSSRTIAT